MTLSATRIRAVLRKELREFRRNRFIISTMVILPIIFIAVPIADLFRIPASAPPALVRNGVGATLLLLLVIPVVVPATLAAYSVIGERDQGTLEPLLATPIRREELLLGKALAAIIPSVTIAYVIFAVVFLSVRAGASAPVMAAVFQPSQILAEVLFAPLLAAWSIWIGMAISARSSDVRVAQQLSTLASLPALGVTALIQFQVIQPSVVLAVVLAAVLVAVDATAWRFVSALFDRERLITGIAS